MEEEQNIDGVHSAEQETKEAKEIVTRIITLLQECDDIINPGPV